MEPKSDVFNCDCLVGIKDIPDNSVDVILTDPPYKYLKNQKLEVDFDELLFFNESKRILKKSGFIVLFGRGTSFYRWNTMLSDLGFKFKEEIIWDKGYCSSPLMNVSRIHETISIHSLGSGTINKMKVPYIEVKEGDFNSIISDINRLKTILKNTKSFDAVLNYLTTNNISGTGKRKNLSTSVSSRIEERDRCASVMQAITDGMTEKTIIRSDRHPMTKKHNTTISENISEGDRCVNVVNSISQGMNEKTILKITGDHMSSIHPTQKPVRLLERLLQLVSKDGDLVVDPFFGSGSTRIACYNMNLNFIGYELDKEYFDASVKRFEIHKAQLKFQFD